MTHDNSMHETHDETSAPSAREASPYEQYRREQQPQPRKESALWEVAKFTFIALLIVVPIRLYVAQPFIVSGASMEPTFDNGEYLIVDQISYRFFDEPERGDVIVFRYPNDPSKFYIKRIAGLPSETISLNGTTVTIASSEHPDGFTIEEPYLESANLKNDFLTIELGADEYFVLGDNRRASSDSRIWGALSERLIVGRAFVRLLPFDAIDILPGTFK